MKKNKMSSSETNSAIAIENKCSAASLPPTFIAKSPSMLSIISSVKRRSFERPLTSYITKAFDGSNGRSFFVKIVRTNHLEEELLRRSMKQKNQGYLVPVIDIFTLEKNRIAFLLRNCYYGTLQSVLNKVMPSPMHLGHFLKIAFSIASALDFLHGYELSHGFLTTDHCLLDEWGYIRLCGLGHISRGNPVSRYRWIDSDKTGYFAPEIMDDAKGELIDPYLVDMFACGVILHLCLTGSFPYSLSINNNAAVSSNAADDFAVSRALTESTVSSTDKEILRKECQSSKLTSVNTFLFPPENHRSNQSAAQKRCTEKNITANNVLTERECVDEALCTVHKLLNENPTVRIRAGALLYSTWLQRGVKQEEIAPSIACLFFNS